MITSIKFFNLKKIIFVSSVFFSFLAIEPGALAEVKVACIGDSITFGSGIEFPEINSYPAQLQALLKEEYKVINFGSSGAAIQKKSNYPYWNLKIYDQALQSKPDIAIIMLGTNDSKDVNWMSVNQFKFDYQEFIKQFRQTNPNVKIYLGLPPPAFSNSWSINNDIIKNQINPVILEIAKEEKLSFFDLYSLFQNQPEFFPDKIHPDAKGAKRIASTVAEMILKNQNSKRDKIIE